MARVLFTYIVPFLLPLAVYLAWSWYRTRYVAEHGGAPPRLEQGPWPLLLFLGAVLAFASLAVTALRHGGGPDSVYTPSYLENGQVVPGRTVSKQP